MEAYWRALRKAIEEAVATNDKTWELPASPIGTSVNGDFGQATFSDEDYGERQMQTLNQLSSLPSWAPGPQHSEIIFQLNYIRFDPELQGRGYGRRVINIIQQGMTRNDGGAQVALIFGCYLPTFLTIDSHYGWLRTEPEIPQETPADLIYPRYLQPETEEQALANRTAVYSYTDLLWSTPLRWLDARFKAFRGEEVPAPVRSGFNSLNWRLAWSTATLRELDGNTEHAAPLALAPLRYAMPVGRDVLARTIAAHCRALGNSDDYGGVNAVLLAPPLVELTPSQTDLAITLAYLIDHARVLYRPIIFTHTVGELLCAALGAGSRGHLNALPAHVRAILPQPTPYFSDVDGTHWLWVPVKKPRSWDGARFVPLPAAETAPLVVEETLTERPAKRFRAAAVQCLHCGAADPVCVPHLALCADGCADAYYE